MLFLNEKKDLLSNVSSKMDTAFNLIFAFESVVKIISLGFAMNEKSYLTDSWNRIDFIIVVTSLLGIYFIIRFFNF